MHFSTIRVKYKVSFEIDKTAIKMTKDSHSTIFQHNRICWLAEMNLTLIESFFIELSPTFPKFDFFARKYIY